MGIRDLYKVIKSECPEVLVRVPLSDCAGKRVAVDVSVFLYKSIRSSGPDRWFESFLHLLILLRKNCIRAVCVFDGPNPPHEKRLEQDRRREEVKKVYTRIAHIEALIETLDEYASGDADYISEEHAQSAEGLLIRSEQARRNDLTDYASRESVLSSLHALADKLYRQSIPIGPEYKARAERIVKMLGLTSIQIEGEAESVCSRLCIEGHVDAVLTEDTDVMVYGTPVMWGKLDMSEGSVEVSAHSDILNGLDLTHETFVDLCIVLGCDYNTRPRGYGPKKAYELFQTYTRLEDAIPEMKGDDIEERLRYERCRTLFNAETCGAEECKSVMRYQSAPELDELREFLNQFAPQCLARMEEITKWFGTSPVIYT